MRKKKGKRLRGSTEDQEGQSRANYKKKMGLIFYYYFLAFFKKIGKKSLFFFIFNILLDINFSSYFYFYNFYLIYLK